MDRFQKCVKPVNRNEAAWWSKPYIYSVRYPNINIFCFSLNNITLCYAIRFNMCEREVIINIECGDRSDLFVSYSQSNRARKLIDQVMPSDPRMRLTT